MHNSKLSFFWEGRKIVAISCEKRSKRRIKIQTQNPQSKKIQFIDKNIFFRQTRMKIFSGLLSLLAKKVLQTFCFQTFAVLEN